MKWSPAVGAAADPLSRAYTVWYRSGIGEALGDVRRERRFTGGLAFQPNDPASIASTLDELDGTEPLTSAQPPARPHETLPEALLEALDEQHFRDAARSPCQSKPALYDPGVVHDEELAVEHAGKLREPSMLDQAGRSPVHEEPRRVARLGGTLRDQLRRKLVIQERRVHPTVRVASPPMDEFALQRARERIAAVSEGRPHPADLSAVLERSRQQVEALAATAAELEAVIPARVGHAVRDGLREEVLPVARHIAEVRGLFQQSIRRLERIETELLAERSARVDDLALLVDLVASGWRGVDARLARLEDAHAETTASLDGLVETLSEDDDAETVPEPVAPIPEPAAESGSLERRTPEAEAPSNGYPAQGSQADAIAERAGAAAA